MHIHLTRDGGILALSESNGVQSWRSISLGQLQSGLASIRAQPDVAIAYSRDDPETDPPKAVELIFKMIQSYGIPLRLLREPLVPLEGRLK
jgi:hypothetical protein